MNSPTIALKGRQELGGFSNSASRTKFIGFASSSPRTLAAPYACRWSEDGKITRKKFLYGVDLKKMGTDKN